MVIRLPVVRVRFAVDGRRGDGRAGVRYGLTCFAAIVRRLSLSELSPIRCNGSRSANCGCGLACL
jgi:hypothetical protein